MQYCVDSVSFGGLNVHVDYTETTNKLQRNYKETTKKLQRNYKETTMKLQKNSL